PGPGPAGRFTLRLTRTTSFVLTGPFSTFSTCRASSSVADRIFPAPAVSVQTAASTRTDATTSASLRASSNLTLYIFGLIGPAATEPAPPPDPAEARQRGRRQDGRAPGRALARQECRTHDPLRKDANCPWSVVS